MNTEQIESRRRANLQLPARFFEDALLQLECQDPARIRHVAAKAHAMKDRASRLKDSALEAEAEMIIKLASEKLATLPKDAES